MAVIDLELEIVLMRSAGSNPKAFAFANPGRLAKEASRSHDVCNIDEYDSDKC